MFIIFNFYRGTILIKCFKGAARLMVKVIGGWGGGGGEDDEAACRGGEGLACEGAINSIWTGLVRVDQGSKSQVKSTRARLMSDQQLAHVVPFDFMLKLVGSDWSNFVVVVIVMLVCVGLLLAWLLRLPIPFFHCNLTFPLDMQIVSTISLLTLCLLHI